MKIEAIYFLLILLCVQTSCRELPTYPVPGVFNGYAAQGMAIYGDYAFLLNDGGMCRIYDLKKKKVENSFFLASADSTNHANSASFGVEYFGGNTLFPCIYISECLIPCRCFVESINTEGSKLVQTLQFGLNGKPEPIQTWIVDVKSKKLYGLSQKRYIPNKPYITIRCFRLPLLAEGDIIFTEKDIENQFDILLPNLLQGGVVRDSLLYLPVGSGGKGSNEISERAMVLINLRQQKIADKIVLNDLTKNEPEDVDFYRDELLMYCGQRGGLWKVDINN